MRDEGRIAPTAAPAVFIPPCRAHLVLICTSLMHICPPLPPRTLCACLRSFVAATAIGVGAPVVSTAPVPAGSDSDSHCCWLRCCHCRHSHCYCCCCCATTAPVATGVSTAAALPCLCWYPLPGCAHLALICACLQLFILVWAHLSVSNTKLVYITIKKTHFDNMYYQPG